MRTRTKWIPAVLILGLLFAAACGDDDDSNDAGNNDTSTTAGSGGTELSGTIKIDGSSTVAPLSEAAAEQFQDANSGVRVTVGTSGTGGGFEKFCNGETDISDASRPIDPEDEAEGVNCKANGIEYAEITIANDALSLVVNPENDWAECLTVEELSSIWNEDSTLDNWSQVRDGFPDEPLELFGAGTDSGTFDYFTDAINGEEGNSRTDYNATEDDNITVQGVGGSKGALGYFGLSYALENADSVKAIAIDSGDGCVEPSAETVTDGTYTPLGRPLFIYISDAALARPEVDAFVQFFLDNNTELAESALVIPLTDEQKAKGEADLKALLAG